MSKDNFFDRKMYLDILAKRISGLKYGYRQNLAVIGDELVGKTSIISKFLNKFHDNSMIMLYLEARPESLVVFVKRFVGVLLYNFLINSGIALKEDLDFLIKKSEKYIPQTVQKIKAILTACKTRNKNNVFAELLALSEILNQETGKFCVVILDEFHHLEGLGVKNLYREWSKLLLLQKNTMYIIISSLKLKTKIILSKNLSLLFGNFELISVEPFDIKTSEEYLEQKIAYLNLDTGLRNFLVHFTGGYPFYLEVIAQALLKSAQASLADILENLLFDTSGILNQRFSSYLKSFSQSRHSHGYISILHLVSSGHNKLKDLAQILHHTKKDLSLKINHLLELDALDRNGDFLKINDRVFGFWLRFVYQEKLQSLTFDAKNQKIQFRDKIKNLIEDFIVNAQRPITERMSELLHLFENDTVQIEKKRLRLNRFREIKPLGFSHRGLKDGLIGRCAESLWIMGFKYDLLTEEDITEFSKECKKYHHKLQRKIIIALRDIDANARLRALEEKILTWDINCLNQILDLFLKPRLIP